MQVPRYFCAILDLKDLKRKILFVVFCKIYQLWLGRNPAEGIIAEPAAVVTGVPNTFFSTDHGVRLRRSGKTGSSRSEGQYSYETAWSASQKWQRKACPKLIAYVHGFTALLWRASAGAKFM